MADRILNNMAEMDGTYNNIGFADSKSTQVTVRLVEVPFTKEADQTIWFSGYLTFTITVDNSDGEGPMRNIVITDQLDVSMFELDDESISVAIGGTTLVLDTDYTFQYTAQGMLTINIINDIEIPVGASLVLSFRGSKVD